MVEQYRHYQKEGSLVGGLVLIGLGTYFLLREFGVIRIGLGRLWPVFLIIVGIGLIIGHFRTPRHLKPIERSSGSDTPAGD